MVAEEVLIHSLNTLTIDRLLTQMDQAILVMVMILSAPLLNGRRLRLVIPGIDLC